MKHNKLSPFGCEITHFDVETAGTEAARAILALLAENGVVVIRDQPVDDDVFVAFLKCLGPMSFTKGEEHLPHAPELNCVSNVGRERPPRSVFHTDTSYVSRPPSITALRPVSLPQSGGETIFTDQYRAFDTLPGDLKTSLRQAKLKHCATGVSLNEDDEQFYYHPVFRRHPVSQRVALYLSTPERCTDLAGFPQKIGVDVIQRLFSHSTQPTHAYRHIWQHGDLLLWDNRCTLHRANHANVEGERTLHRGMVAGEEPIAAN